MTTDMTKKSVRELLIRLTKELLDPVMSESGFRRRQNALVFSRRVEGSGRQVVLINFAFHPPYHRSADAHLYPRIHLLFPEINTVVAEMMGQGAYDVTLNQPLDLVLAKRASGSWYFSGEAEAREAVNELGERTVSWVLPFLDDFSSVEAYADGIERRDERLMLTETTSLDLVGARIVSGRPQEALAAFESRFNSARSRREYAGALAYVSRQATAVGR